MSPAEVTADEFIMRPSPARFRASLKVRLAFFAPLAISALAFTARSLLGGGLGAVVTGGCGIAVACLTAALYALFLRNVAYSARPDHLQRSNIFGCQRTWRRVDLDRAVVRTVNIGQGPIERCAFLGLDGTAVATIAMPFFDRAALDALCGVLGLPIDQNPATLTGRQFRTEFPKALSWWEANALLVGLGIAFLIVAAVVVAVLLVSALSMWIG
jgi:hypothetical protein